MQGALTYFSDIDGSRSLRNQKHSLITLIGTTLLASLAGIDSFSGFADFTGAHFDNLIEYFDFPYGCPSHDTYQRLWEAIDSNQFYKSFLLFTAALEALLGLRYIIKKSGLRSKGSCPKAHYN